MGKMIGLLSVLLLTAAQPCVAQEASRNAKTLADGCAVLSRMEAGDTTILDNLSAEQEGAAITSAGYCGGYLNGFIGGYSAAAYANTSTAHYCLPPNVTVGQIARVLVKQLEQSPQFEHFQQLPFVLGVLGSAWPCDIGGEPS